MFFEGVKSLKYLALVVGVLVKVIVSSSIVDVKCSSIDYCTGDGSIGFMGNPY